MSDLISREWLLKQCDYITDIEGMIENAPTAFDVDNVLNKIIQKRIDVQEKLRNSPDDIHAAVLRGQLRGIADCLEIINEARNGERG